MSGGRNKKYLADNSHISNLYLIDIVCHGVPSPKIWKDYIFSLENKYSSKVQSYTFRDKLKGWRGYHPSVKLKNGEVIEENSLLNTYIELFKDNFMLRDSCYKCPYSSLQRTGDFSIGDFWGIEDIDPVFTDNKGISMLFINSERGKALFDLINRENFRDIKEYPTSLLKQQNLFRHTDRSFKYDSFWKIYLNDGYESVVDNFTSHGRKYKKYYYEKAFRLRLGALKSKMKKMK